MSTLITAQNLIVSCFLSMRLEPEPCKMRLATLSLGATLMRCAGLYSPDMHEMGRLILDYQTRWTTGGSPSPERSP